VARTIEKLVEVIPRAIWIALGLLLGAALALGGRTVVERRRARGLRREREQLAHEVHLLERALLPEVPVELGALAASVAYRSCEGPAAGGDFYDAVELGDGRVAALVGDVSGHGPDALERTNWTRTEVRACLEAGMSPRLALQAVGTRAGLHESGRFVTVVVAVHDRSAGTLTYATAGHSPPIVSGPGAHEPIIAVSSPPIGLGFPTGLRETTVPLPPGSVGCLFTDGLLEARVDGELLGRERLAALVDDLADDETAQVLLGRVIAEADEANDDMAVLVLRVRPGLYAVPPRVEILEVDADDLDHGVAEAFLDACGLSPEAAASVLDDARECVSRTERALVEITFDCPGARADVRPGSAPRAPTPA
jgi:serine phosphatase RsbU (regulator of sigma subunit)